MGLTTWKNAPEGEIYKSDVSIAKNYLTEDELESLNRIVTMYLDYAELQAKNKKVMYMADWAKKLDSFLQFNERDILQNNDLAFISSVHVNKSKLTLKSIIDPKKTMNGDALLIFQKIDNNKWKQNEKDLETIIDEIKIKAYSNSDEYRSGYVTIFEDNVRTRIHITQGGTCNNCHGSGSVSCAQCMGQGGWGYGMFYSQCWLCHGTGSLQCGTCHGTGERE